MIETTTIARDLITPDTNQLIRAEAQAILDANPDAVKNFQEHVKEISNAPNFTGDAYATAREYFPEDFDAYALASYATKTIDILKRLPDDNLPKITLAHPLVTGEVMAGLITELTKHEEIAKKPWRTLNPIHAQSRERLDKLAKSRSEEK